MKNTYSRIAATNLLFALELLDESVRVSAIKDSYVGSATEQTVTDAMRQAKKESLPSEGRPAAKPNCFISQFLPSTNGNQ